MPYNRENLVESKRAYQIVTYLNTKEDGSYASEIAEDLEIDRSMVAEILNKFSEMNVLKKNPETKRPQYYNLNLDNFAELLFYLLAQKDKSFLDEEDFENPEEYYLAEVPEEQRKKFRDFVRRYVELYLEDPPFFGKVPDLKTMLVDDLIDRIEHKILSKIEDESDLPRSVIMFYLMASNKERVDMEAKSLTVDEALEVFEE